MSPFNWYVDYVPPVVECPASVNNVCVQIKRHQLFYLLHMYLFTDIVYM